MRGLVQPAAPGLLSLLDLKQRGSNPDTLSGTIVPTVDLTHWLQADEPEIMQAAGLSFITGTDYAGAALLVSPAALEVPANEMWWVREYTVAIQCAAGISAVNIQQLMPVLFYRNGSSVGSASFRRGRLVGQSCPVTNIVPASGLMDFHAPSLRDFWAPPGSLFGFYFSGGFSFAAAAPGVIGSATINRLLI